MSNAQTEILELATAYFTENPHAVLAQFVREVHVSEGEVIGAAKAAPIKYAFAAHQILTTGRSVVSRKHAEELQAQPDEVEVRICRRHKAAQTDRQLGEQMTDILKANPRMSYREVAVELHRSYWEVCQTARKLGLVSAWSNRSPEELTRIDGLVKAEWDKDNNQSIRNIALTLCIPYNAARDAYIRMGLQNNLTAKRSFEKEVVEYCNVNPSATTRDVATHFERSLSTIYKIMDRHGLLTPERKGRYVTTACRLPKIKDEDIKKWVETNPEGTIRDAMAIFKCGRMAVVDALSRNGLKIQRHSSIEESIYNSHQCAEERKEQEQAAAPISDTETDVRDCLTTAESIIDPLSFAASCGLSFSNISELASTVERKLSQIDRLMGALATKRSNLEALSVALDAKQREERAKARVIEAIQKGDAQTLQKILSVLKEKI